MSLLERDSVLVSTTENGDPIVDLPFTRVNNVEGIGRSPNTTYSVGDVVYTDTNMQVALKCTTAGTTSADELDISGNNVGDTVTDGTVVWQVCNRTSDVTSVNGKTGDVVVGEVTDLSISGRTVTVTFADSTTKTLTTQDTDTNNISASSVGASGYTKFSNGMQIVWTSKSVSGWLTDNKITLPKAFADTNYVVVTHDTVYPSVDQAIYMQAHRVQSKATTSVTIRTAHGETSTVYVIAIGKGA